MSADKSCELICNLLLRCLTLACLWAAVSNSHAATLEFLIEEKGRKIPQSTQVEKDRVVIRSAGGDTSTDILFDASSNTLFVIDHGQRSYMRIDEKVINEMSALFDTVSDVVGSQQNVLTDLLSTFGLGGNDQPKKPSAAPTELADSGRDLFIGGISCRLYQAVSKKQLQAEACFARQAALKITAQEFQTLQKLTAFGNTLVGKARGLLDVLGATVPAVQLKTVPGVPIGLHDQVEQRKVKLVEINGIHGLDGLRIPDGYTQTAIPFTSG